MNDISLIEKLKILIDIIVSSPIFFVCSIIGIFLLIFLIVCIVTNKKINKWLFIFVWLVICIILLFIYNNIIFSMIDNFFDNVFMALYFPNLFVYITLIIIVNVVFIYSIFKKNIQKNFKIINIVEGMITDFLLILIIGIISSANININDNVTIYTNSNLLVLFQLTTGLFTSWILVLLLTSASNKLKKYDKVKIESNSPELIFDD